MDVNARRSHTTEQIEAWRAAGTVCRVCGGTGIARRSMAWWYHRSWQRPIADRCWFCDGDGRLDPDEDSDSG